MQVKATGELTLRGTAKKVTIPLEAQRSGSSVKVAGSFPIVFEEWGIPNPSFGPADTEDKGSSSSCSSSAAEAPVRGLGRRRKALAEVPM